MIALLLACAEPPAPPAALVPTAPAPWSAPQGFTELRLSLTPYDDAAELATAREPFRRWLEARLGIPVHLHAAASYDDLAARMRAGEVDIGEFSPYLYVRVRYEDPTLRPLVGYIADGSATSAGYIVVRSDSSAMQLEDLEGRSFAFVDPLSTTGWLYPSALLAEAGVTPSRTASLGNHRLVLLGVHSGAWDAGAVYDGALPALQRSHGIGPLDFRIIGKTPRIPRDLWCARGDLPESVRREFSRLMLGISVRTLEGRRILDPMGVNGFVEVDDHAFEPIRRADAKLRP